MIVMHDSNSDGMCGFVEMLDKDSGEIARVRWSVTSEPRSQSAAIEEAREQLLLSARQRLESFQREMRQLRESR